MKKFIITTFHLLIVMQLIAQVRLEANMISAKTKLKPTEEIMVFVKETKETTLTDSLGNFTLLKLEKNRQYSLELKSYLYGNVILKFETENDNVINKKFEIIANCDFDSETANTEWKNKTAKLYLIGSIAPITNSKADKKFEKKYHIKYFDFGCTPAPTECIIEYNKEVFKLMKLAYGEEWKKEIRKDVVVN